MQTSSSSPSQREDEAPPPEVDKPLTQNAHRRVMLWKAVSRVTNCFWSTCSVREKLHAFRRVYAIIDEQSNSSLVSTELADWEQTDLKKSTFLPHTKETKYGVCVTDVVQSVSGAAADLPTLLEAAISLKTNERSQHRRWRGDSHIFRRSPTRSHPSMGPLTFISSSEETPQNFLKFESLGTDLKEPPGHKSFL